MHWLVIAAAVLVGLYLFFAVFPAIGVFLGVFTRKKGLTRGEDARDDSIYAKYYALYKEGFAFLSQLPSREISVTADDGITLRADWYDGGFSRTAILVHGYAVAPMYNYALVGYDLYRQGYNLLMIWQRGHGKSGGRFTTLGLAESHDLSLWVRLVHENTPEQKIILFGTSMGAATVEYASEELSDKVDAMVLDCGYASVEDAMAVECRLRHIPVWLEMPLMRAIIRIVLRQNIRKKTADALSRTTIPAFFLHGTDDSGVPVEQGKANFAACASEKECLWVEGAVHAMAYAVGRETVLRRLYTFLDRYTKE